MGGKVSKTEEALLARVNAARAKGDAALVVTSRWECSAARRLLDRGHAKSYKSTTEHRFGETYYDHFHRRYATRKSYVVYGGILTL